MNRNVYQNISPLDARYYASNRKLVERLSDCLSEQSVIRYQALVEAAIITVMERYGMVPRGAGEQMQRACSTIDPDEVYREEARTRHNVRALVLVLQRMVDERVAPFVHLTATSEDITGTAQTLGIRDAFYLVVMPACVQLMEIMLGIVEREAGTVQIGRTHGQHAVLVTVGYLFAGYADRLGGRLLKIKEAVDELRGKVSGAVGAYNAGALLFDDPRKFEEDVLGELGLRPGNFASQIVEPEYMLDLVHAVVSAFGVLAQIGDDIRHLQRTEIAEMGERFEKGQVGSSTMPHKRNPWNFEHVKSMWKEFMPRMVTRYMDQISEHQRDLTNSASGRFVAEIVTAFTLCLDRLSRQMKKLVIDPGNLLRNLDLTEGMFLAEPLYILLASQGVANAHELVREATLRAQREGKQLFQIVRQDERFGAVAGTETWKMLAGDPSSYCGKARERALAILYTWKPAIDKVQEECSAYREACPRTSRR